MFKPETKIMVVDDMMTMRKIVAKSLKEFGFTNISDSSDGELAWPVIKTAAEKNEPFGLIISDWNMPKVKGIELLRLVRADEKTGKTPFMLLTAESEMSQIQEAVKAGVDSYLVKPFMAESLKEKLGQVYKKRFG
jgi:two-component system chemotaxis response regulator CheY